VCVREVYLVRKEFLMCIFVGRRWLCVAACFLDLCVCLLFVLCVCVSFEEIDALVHCLEAWWGLVTVLCAFE